MNNMKMKLVLFASVSIALASCQTTPKEDYSWIKKGLDVASAQLQLSAEEVSGTGMLPRSIRTGYDMDFLCRQLERDSSTFKDSLRAQPTADQLGKRRLCNVYDWTSGFFPGSLWYAYELTGNDTLKTQAIQYTNLLNPVRYYKGTHDLGFMVNCSYGNAERLSPNDTIAAVMRETADNLCGRFNDSIGAIRSWDFGTWNFPVIIDNMMNLMKLASSLEPIFQIGKSSLTPECTAAIAEAFNTRELIKISVLKNCFDDPREIAAIVAERTHSTVVQVIGKKIVLYKESKDHKKIELPL